MPSFHSLLQLSLGPTLIGFCLDIFLFGITTVQTYLYYQAFPSDRAILQCLVYGVYAVGVLQTGLATRDLFIIYSERYGYIKPNMDPSDRPDWNSGLHFAITIPICGTLVACAVQLFYAHRIRVLGGIVYIPLILAALAVLQWVGASLVAAGTYPVQIGKNDPAPEPVAAGKQAMNSSAFIGNVIWGTVTSTCDIVIAAYMVIYLSKRKTYVRHTQVRITRLIRLIVETGSLTATVSISFVLTMLLAPGGFFMIPGLTIAKIYSISLLVLLNNRFKIPGGRQREEPSLMLPSELREQETALDRSDPLPQFATYDATSGQNTNV